MEKYFEESDIANILLCLGLQKNPGCLDEMYITDNRKRIIDEISSDNKNLVNELRLQVRAEAAQNQSLMNQPNVIGRDRSNSIVSLAEENQGVDLSNINIGNPLDFDAEEDEETYKAYNSSSKADSKESINWKNGTLIKDGKERKLTAGELDEYRRERNRMHAKLTRSRKKMFLSKMREAIEELEKKNLILREQLNQATQAGKMMSSPPLHFSSSFSSSSSSSSSSLPPFSLSPSSSSSSSCSDQLKLGLPRRRVSPPPSHTSLSPAMSLSSPYLNHNHISSSNVHSGSGSGSGSGSEGDISISNATRTVDDHQMQVEPTMSSTMANKLTLTLTSQIQTSSNGSASILSPSTQTVCPANGSMGLELASNGSMSISSPAETVRDTYNTSTLDHIKDLSGSSSSCSSNNTITAIAMTVDPEQHHVNVRNNSADSNEVVGFSNFGGADVDVDDTGQLTKSARLDIFNGIVDKMPFAPSPDSKSGR